MPRDSSDGADRAEPSLSRAPRLGTRRAVAGGSGPHALHAIEAAGEAAPDLVLRAGERVAVTSDITAGESEAGGSGLLRKAAIAGVVLLALFGAISLLRMLTGW